MKISKIIKLYRAVNDIGVRELANELKISPATLSRIENGKDVEGKTMLLIINWLFSTEEKE